MFYIQLFLQGVQILNQVREVNSQKELQFSYSYLLSILAQKKAGKLLMYPFLSVLLTNTLVRDLQGIYRSPAAYLGLSSL